MYKQYLAEREQKHVVESEHGFAIYRFTDKWCYICDIYVTQEARIKHEASRLADSVAEIALNAGYKRLLGSVDTRDAGASISLIAQLKYGFKVLYNDGQVIYLEKILKPD